MGKTSLFFCIILLLPIIQISLAQTVCSILYPDRLSNCRTSPCDWSTSGIWTCKPAAGAPNGYPSGPTTTANATLNSVFTLSIEPNISSDGTGLTLAALTLGTTGITSAKQTIFLNGEGLKFAVSSATILQNGVLAIDIGTSTFSGTYILTNGGTINWNSGAYVGAITSAPMNVTNGCKVNVNPSTIGFAEADKNVVFNSGSTFTVQNGGNFVVGPDATVTVNLGATFNLLGTSSVSTVSTGRLNCYGNLKLTPGEFFTSTLAVNFNTNQTVTTDKGTLNIGGTATFTAPITNGAAFTLNIASTLITTSTVVNNGIIVWNGTRWNLASAPLTNANSLTLAGSLIASTGGQSSASVITNNNQLFVTTPVTMRGVTITLSAGDSILTQVDALLTSSTLNINGGTINGEGSISVNSGTLSLNGGLVAIPITVTSAAAGAVLSGGSIRNVVLSVAAPTTINGVISLVQGNDITVIPGIANSAALNAANGQIKMSEVETIGSFTNNAGGIITGNLQFNDGVQFINNGQIGATYAASNPVVQLTIGSGGLTLSDSSVIYIDLFGSSKGYVNVNGNLTLGGTMIVRFRSDFIPAAGQTFDVFTYPSATNKVHGAWSTAPSVASISSTGWTNPSGCSSYTLNNNAAKSKWTVSFAGCGSSSPPEEIHKSNNSTIVIVVVVVFVVALIAGTIAWCKKKYRKRPWDRLRGDRL